MVRRCKWVSGTAGAFAAMLGAWLTACGNSSGGGGGAAATTCVPGKVEACFGPDHCAGAQVCSDQGDRYTPCTCSRGSTSAGSGGNGPGGEIDSGAGNETAGSGGAGGSPI